MARKYMKIAMVGQKRVPSHDGGIEVVVGELAKRMVAQGHSVTCYNRTDKQQPQPEKFQRHQPEVCTDHPEEGTGGGFRKFLRLPLRGGGQL